MLPEVRKLITNNQELLYISRKGEMIKKWDLCNILGKSYQTVQKKIDSLRENKIILEPFLVNPDFAYFAGFYITESEIELEIINFLLEPVTIPNFETKCPYHNPADVWKIMKNMLDQLPNIIKIENISIIFDVPMSYSKNRNTAYSLDGENLKIHNLCMQLTMFASFMDPLFLNAVLGDNVLSYALFLREKIFDSDIVYFDLDQQRISYVKNDILQMDENPQFGMILPRFTDQQKTLFKKLEKLSDSDYESMLINEKDELIQALELSFIQIQNFLSPTNFIIGGKWIRKPAFENFCFLYMQNHLNGSPLPIVMNKENESQKGAGIYAAYSFFNWKLKW